MKLIYCHQCRQELPREAFDKYGVQRDQFRNPQCRACWDEKYFGPTRIKARSIAVRAVKMGLIKKPVRCAYCLRTAKLDGHHVSYDAPLEIVWYCRHCHQKWHGYGL